MQFSDWRIQWTEAVCTPNDMVRFVDAVGCCTAKALPGYPDFPSQSEAMGTLDVNTIDPWFWKDDLHIEKLVYYTRVFGGQPGFVSYKLLPAFIATNGATADELQFQGMLSPDAQQIYRAIEAHGPVPIKTLKQQLMPQTKSASTRILHDLERKFIITKSGITGRTRGTYGYIWDLVERWIPETLIDADRLSQATAISIIRDHLAKFKVQSDSPFYLRVLGWKC